MKKILLPTSIVCLMLFFLAACTSPNADTNQVAKASMAPAADAPVHEGLHIGDTAPDFNLKNVDGSMVSLAGMKDAKGYIVVFTCNHCPYAVMYEDRLIDLHNTYASKGYPVVAINPNDPSVVPSDSFEAMQERSKEKGFPFVYLFDEGQKVYPKYGAKKTPHVFLMNNERVVSYIGAVDDNHEDEAAVNVKYLENAIASMEKGVAADPAMTKAIGCSIKSKNNPPRKKKKMMNH